NAFHSNPTNTVFDAKRLIGRKTDDLELKCDIKHFPFNIQVVVIISYKGDTHSTEEISAMILTKMKETAEEIKAYLSEKVTHAVGSNSYHERAHCCHHPDEMSGECIPFKYD
ncbi:Hsp70 protein-domain-containing protein, partial [Suillus subluteus]